LDATTLYLTVEWERDDNEVKSIEVEPRVEQGRRVTVEPGKAALA